MVALLMIHSTGEGDIRPALTRADTSKGTAAVAETGVETAPP